MRYWGAFAAQGDPAVKGAPAWPTYGSAGRVMSLRTGGKSAVITSCQSEHNCAFWLG
jgi:para-nitrobenzyl esterase